MSQNIIGADFEERRRAVSELTKFPKWAGLSHLHEKEIASARAAMIRALPHNGQVEALTRAYNIRSPNGIQVYETSIFRTPYQAAQDDLAAIKVAEEKFDNGERPGSDCKTSKIPCWSLHQ